MNLIIIQFKEVLKSIYRNKYNLFLNTIGIFWGMVLFILLLGLSNGVENGFHKDIGGKYVNSVILWSGNTSIPYNGKSKFIKINLSLDDIKLIQNKFDNLIINISPKKVAQDQNISYNNQTYQSNINSYYPRENNIFYKKIMCGRDINQGDLVNFSKVCVIGIDLYRKLFGDLDCNSCIGKYVNISGIYYNIIGIYKNPVLPIDDESQVYIPYKNFSKIYNSHDIIDYISISIKDDTDIVLFEKEIKKYLTKIKNIHKDDINSFYSFNLGELLNKTNAFIYGMKLLSVVIAFSILISGTISISSILLISVSSRFKEYAILRCVGIKNNIIKFQIILESILISLIPSLIGIISGELILLLLNNFVFNNIDIPIYNAGVNYISIILAILFILFVSILSAIIPSNVAMKISPAEILK